MVSQAKQHLKKVQYSKPLLFRAGIRKIVRRDTPAGVKKVRVSPNYLMGADVCCQEFIETVSAQAWIIAHEAGVTTMQPSFLEGAIKTLFNDDVAEELIAAMNKNPWLLAQFDKKKVQAIAQVKRRHAARLAKKAAEAEGKTVEAVPAAKQPKGKGKKTAVEAAPQEKPSDTASQQSVNTRSRRGRQAAAAAQQ